MNDIKLYKAFLKPAPCAADISDGSERGEYVCQDYLFEKFGRPHRGVNIMYCYYPYDAGWPNRASSIYRCDISNSVWGYPYDDYFPYEGGIHGSHGSEPFSSMRDIRRHGQDVILTLTIDPTVTDDDLISIAKDLRPYGRLMLRINHEATGSWFAFNKRCTYQQVADFYVRFHKIIKQYAPNIRTILCLDGLPHSSADTIDKEAEFSDAVKCCDIWSTDKYIALNWGWPAQTAQPGGNCFRRENEQNIYDLISLTYKRFCHINNFKSKPMYISEINTDADVVGAIGQAVSVEKFYKIILDLKPDWLSAVCFYQFRDRGHLGLECESTSDKNTGIEQPVLESYRKIISESWFSPVTQKSDSAELPLTMRWGSSEDADGIVLETHINKIPAICELFFSDSGNYIIKFNNRWYYKSSNTRYIDLMTAFNNCSTSFPYDAHIYIFAPPADGVNDLVEKDGDYNSYYTLRSLPQLRIYYDEIK